MPPFCLLSTCSWWAVPLSRSGTSLPFTLCKGVLHQCRLQFRLRPPIKIFDRTKWSWSLDFIFYGSWSLDFYELRVLILLCNMATTCTNVETQHAQVHEIYELFSNHPKILHAQPLLLRAHAGSSLVPNITAGNEATRAITRKYYKFTE